MLAEITITRRTTPHRRLYARFCHTPYSYAGVPRQRQLTRPLRPRPVPPSGRSLVEVATSLTKLPFRVADSPPLFPGWPHGPDPDEPTEAPLFASLTLPPSSQVGHMVQIPTRLDPAPYLDGGAVARRHSQKRKLLGGATPVRTPAPLSTPPPDLPPLPPPYAGALLEPVAALAAAPMEERGAHHPPIDSSAASKSPQRAEPMDVEPPVGVVAPPSPSGIVSEPPAGGAAGSGTAYELFAVLLHRGSASAGGSPPKYLARARPSRRQTRPP